ncbi:hypothetical protein ABH923_003612 [Leifsonia sp. EB41]|uniref:hypothetical protein n=1 Tax=Leifsonia sp. EB41 TaxID=3156260 RepID=UPI003514271E
MIRLAQKSMKVLQLHWEAASRAAVTRRDAFGIVVLASIACATAGTEHLWAIVIAFVIPDIAVASFFLIRKIDPRVMVESQVTLYPVVLIVLGLSGGVGTFSGLLLSAGAGWLMRIAIQRLVGSDFERW